MLGDEDARAAAEASEGIELLWWGRTLSGVGVDLACVDTREVAELLDDAWYRRAPRKVAAACEAAPGAPDADR